MNKKYLIIQNGQDPFQTDYFEYENHYQEGMVVFNILRGLFTEDGKNWLEIEEDYL